MQAEGLMHVELCAVAAHGAQRRNAFLLQSPSERNAAAQQHEHSPT